MTVYIDLNVFDRIEKINRLESPEKELYQCLLDMIKSDQVITAYSNAHLNDLFRGYQKNPAFINSHLNNLKTLTKDLCICQYWGNANVTWSRRDIFAFFNEKVEEIDFLPDNYDDFISGMTRDMPELSFIYEMHKRLINAHFIV